MHTFIITVLVFLFSFPAQAQMEKVLISCPGASYKYFYEPLDSIIPLHYKYGVELNYGVLPDSLENYNAIFIAGHYGSDQDSILNKEILSLTKYLKSGGNVFFDLSFIGQALDAEMDVSEFKYLVGVNRELVALSFLYGIQRIYGFDSEFTQGYSTWRETNPFEQASSALVDLEGDVTPILQANGSSHVNMAWAYANDNHKSVVHWPLASEHLHWFIPLVLCNYFNLCTPLSVENEIASTSFEITNPAFMRDRNELLFGYKSPSVTKFDISVYNILGERVYYSYDNNASSTSSEMRIRLNGHLASGGYFFVVKTTDGVARKPFFVVN